MAAEDSTATVSNPPSMALGLQFILSLLRPYRGRMAFAITAATLSVALEVVPIYMTMRMIESVVSGTATGASFIQYGLMLLAIVPLAYILFGIATTQSHLVAFGVLYELRKKVCAHMARLPLGYLSGKQSGSIRKLVIDDPEALEVPIAHAMPEGISALVMWLVVSVWLFVVDWRMALVAIIVTPISFVMMGYAVGKTAPRMRDYQNDTRRMNGAVTEFLAGISAIKIFRGAQRSQDEAASAIDQMSNSKVDWGLSFVPLGGVFFALVLANIVLILPFGMYFYGQGSLSLAEFLLFVILGGNYSTPLLRLLNLMHSLGHTSLTATELEDVFKQVPQTDTGATLPLDGLDIVFSDVYFAYEAEDVIKGISFTAQANTVTALVGPSGSGKSTVATLIARFFDVERGTVTIGGQDVTEIGRDQLMGLVSFVFQDTFLFAGTIEENLRFAKADATQAELDAACRAAHAADFIAALPKGYQTIIGDGAGVLSGGERQRLAIARAILKDAPIVILDEATAFADPDSEAEIQKAISSMAAGKTLIVVAHRLHSIAGAEQILVLDEGQIVEAGRHDALCAAGGLYARMWRDYMAVRDGGIRQALPETHGQQEAEQ